MTKVIFTDPSSPLTAAKAGWQHPASREWQAIAALHDRVTQAHFENSDEAFMDRPWNAPKPRPTAMPRGQLDALLARQRALPAQQQTPSRDLRPDN